MSDSNEKRIVAARLEELRALEPGWLDGEGEAISPAALVTAQRLLDMLLSHQLGRPGIYPTPAGGVVVEEIYPGGPYALAGTSLMCDVGIQPNGDIESATFVVQVDDDYEEWKESDLTLDSVAGAWRDVVTKYKTEQARRDA